MLLPKNTDPITTTTQKLTMDQYLSKKQDNLFGVLEIPSLKIKQPIYQLGTKENNVDQNVMLLEHNEKWISLAAHSGTGTHAYFKNLNRVQIGDVIEIRYQNQTEQYLFLKKEEVKKTGTILIEEQEFPFLVLITCSKTNHQIQEVYYAKLNKIY